MGDVAAVLFDLDGTICEYERSADELLDRCFERVGLDPFFGQREYLSRFVDFAHEGSDVREIREACFAAIAEEDGRDGAVGVEVARAYADLRDHANVRFTPGAERGLAAIAARYPVGLVTNGDEWMQSQKLEALGIADRFETVVHAGYELPAKPEPDPFQAALDAMGVGVGGAGARGPTRDADDPPANAPGGRGAGLDARTAPPRAPDYVLDSMADLTDPPWS
jgi:putative hydrolase of the HAD superfamily